MEQIIHNEYLNIRISSLGAELQSVTGTDGREYLWYGDEKFWSSRAPLLFPVCGGLMDDSYTLNGKKYSMPKHGFAKHSEFTPEDTSDDSCTFLLKSHEKTLSIFPFEFELRVKYSLEKSSLKVGYSVKNMSDGTMYFSIGAHEGYYLPGGIEEYSIEFEKPETLDTFEFDGSFPNGKKRRILENSLSLPLEYKYFDDDTLMFRGLSSKKAAIVHCSGEKIAEVDFSAFKYLLFWTMPDAPYICIEPWQGSPDPVGLHTDFSKKPDITALPAGEEFNILHTIVFGA